MSDVLSSPLSITLDGERTTVETGTTGVDLFQGRRDVVVLRVNGHLKDLDTTVAEGDEVEGVTIDSPDGLDVLRHSAAHVLAQAVQQVNPDAKLGIGPPVRDGFYYDFDVETPFTPDDLKALDKAMARIVKDGQTFKRRVVTDDEARAELANEPYKLELIGLKGSGSADEAAGEGVSVEVGAGELTIYDNLRRDGSVAWKDLCRGPHLPSTRLIGNGFQLMRSAAAYWRGSEKNPQLQRVYGTAWPTKDELRAYTERLAEAERRDHRRLGVELDLFSFPDEIGSGLAVFHPKGGIIRNEMEEYSRKRHIEAGYSFVNSPHITKEKLYQVSGHLDWYAEGMYPPMHLDEERDADGTLRRAGQNYYLKPMNCPMHNLIFDARGRSYRELPLRLFEFGTVYRYEKSGVVHGLTRARGFTQDDAHIYCTRDQMKSELTDALTFVLDLLKDYGLDDFYLELSTRDPEKSVGTDDAWEEATETLRQVAEESGLALVPDPGGAAFYGPKISVQAKDAIGRTWQMSTIQLDFNLPEKFDLEYQASDGTRQRPVMIHRALFGSIERFFAVLTEHYAGAFPAWLAPVQVVAVPVAEPFNDYLADVVAQLRAQGIRAEVDYSDDRFGKKIRTASTQKVPFVLIAGGEDVEAGAVSFRYRDGRQDNGVPVAEAIERIVSAVRERSQV
ncbi:threonine--tRNA ligase [Oerskovia turbata]|uniref:Threonine--tRNA ligase n=1 Tax=Oerskovia turbata TaxID=1713 RepID=A0A4V1N5A9_9CELL|nr:threonine--tRNA ligase [Oerskovia turbata]RXR24770.1 threonine--tRNA ligase [Oerskovia turbata]RXR35026.1 threonine--tRNA ligase [Oerskovia turbata]TGJ97092.1 threonine--tRNA ligase [Actinotalea fermentans ATCC 43279 = JCM 9966 = DSM 3133]